MEINKTQVYCKNLSEDQIKKLESIYESYGYVKPEDEILTDWYRYIMVNSKDGIWFSSVETSFTTLSFEEFVEQFEKK